MGLEKTTVVVGEEDLRIIGEAAAREGRSVSDFVRESVHSAALRARRWPEDGEDGRRTGGRWPEPVLSPSRALCQNSSREQH